MARCTDLRFAKFDQLASKVLAFVFIEGRTNMCSHVLRDTKLDNTRRFHGLVHFVFQKDRSI
jgi:hypothetical protein